MSELAVPSENNTAPELRDQMPALILRIIAEAISFVTVGVPEARSRQSRPGGSVFDAWLPLIGLSVSMIAVGALAVGGIDNSIMRAFGAALAVTGLFLSVVTVTVPCALQRMAPPATRTDTTVSEAAKGPLAPASGPSALVELAEGVWVAQTELTFHGMPMGARMTVLDLGEAGLLMHSPIEPTPSLVEAVLALGQVRWIVAPNALHHMWVDAWAKRFEGVELIAAPGLDQRRSDLPWSTTLRGPSPTVPWPSELVEASVVEGHKLLEEIVLFHRPSGTLVVADMIQNLGHAPETSRRDRFYLRLAGASRRPAPPNDYKLTIIDSARVRVALDRVEQWPFERIVLAHGRLVEVDAKDVLSDAFSFCRT